MYGQRVRSRRQSESGGVVRSCGRLDHPSYQLPSVHTAGQPTELLPRLRLAQGPVRLAAGRVEPVCSHIAAHRPHGVCLQGEEGIQTREVNCVLKADGSAADHAICEYLEPKPRQEQACLIPCPQDCVVTEFTPWTTCSKTCGLGLQNRVRSVVTPPLFGGLPCPNLTEFQTCAPRACEGREDSVQSESWWMERVQAAFFNVTSDLLCRPLAHRPPSPPSPPAESQREEREPRPGDARAHQEQKEPQQAESTRGWPLEYGNRLPVSTSGVCASKQKHSVTQVSGFSH